MRQKALFDSRLTKPLIFALICIFGLLIATLIAEGKIHLLLFLLGAFLFCGALAISSEILLAFLLITSQARSLFPTLIKIGEVDIGVTDVIYMIILFKVFLTLSSKKSVRTLNTLNSKFLLSLTLFCIGAFLSIIIPPLSNNFTLQLISLIRFSTYLLLPFVIILSITNIEQVLFLANLIIYTSIFQVFIAITHLILTSSGYDLTSLIGLLTTNSQMLSFSGEGLFRLTGTLGDPAQMAFLLLVGFLLSVELSVLKYRYQGISGKIMKAAPIILLCGLFLTQTRNAWIALVAAFISSLFLKESKVKGYFKIVITVVIVFLAIHLFISTKSIPIRTTLETGYDRFAGWRIGWAIFLDNPFWGIGWSGYRFESGKYLTAALPVFGSFSKSLSFTKYASSLGLYTQILSDLGLLGFGALIFLFYSAFRMIKRLTFAVEDLELKSLGRGILLIFVAFYSFSIFDVTFFAGSYISFLFFLLTGLVAALCVQPVDEVAKKSSLLNQINKTVAQ